MFVLYWFPIRVPRKFTEKKKNFQQMVLGHYPHAKKWNCTLSHLMYKRLTQIISKTNYMTSKYKNHGRKCRYNLYGLGLGISFLVHQSTSNQRGKNKLDFFKIENICASKDTINKMKRWLTEWEKYFKIRHLMKF